MSKFESDNLSVRIELTIVKHSGLLFMANFFLTVQKKRFHPFFSLFNPPILASPSLL